MKIGTAFPSNYLKAADLGGQGVSVTIRGVKEEEVGRDKDTKPVLYFKGKEKGLVLNKTNSRTITKLVGTDETEEWTGHEVVLYPTETEFAGEMVDCIRVRAPKAQTRRGEAQGKTQPRREEPQETEETLRDDFVPSDDDVPF